MGYALSKEQDLGGNRLWMYAPANSSVLRSLYNAQHAAPLYQHGSRVIAAYGYGFRRLYLSVCQSFVGVIRLVNLGIPAG
ncbi:uncharacterized protein ARMOST_02510 [Armillaria ostoyae]|uniref:Uncharacterized protein n=1 Tax=Armillaria ostoyae TaxID=47428 RepID=A0A284QRW6_ARMOS|nr:uncharacterized protein ARMOST_02510 [Armillaria ostoyae]